MFKRSHTAEGIFRASRLAGNGEETSGSSSEISPLRKRFGVVDAQELVALHLHVISNECVDRNKQAFPSRLGDGQGALLSIYDPTGLAAALPW